MAKDPAFLFYPGDWQGGTTTMSRHMKGCYIDLLVAQFNSGPLSLEEIKIVLGTDFPVWGSLSKKFKQTGNGLFFNERLEAEKTKRAEYSLKQKERISKRWNKPGTQSGNTVVLPIENGNKNEDENDLKIKKESHKKVPRGTAHDFTQPDIEGDTLLFPLDTKPMRELWTRWKKYRWEKYQARYGFMGEQADLKRLERMTFDQIQSTILAAISNGWKNLYPEQNRNQGNGKSGNKKQQHMDQVKQSVASHYESVFAKGGGKPDG